MARLGEPLHPLGSAPARRGRSPGSVSPLGLMSSASSLAFLQPGGSVVAGRSPPPATSHPHVFQERFLQ